MTTNNEKSSIWTEHNLWLPSTNSIPINSKGWFNMKKIQETIPSFSSYEFNLPNTSTVSTHKSLIIRLFPNTEQKDLIRQTLFAFKWYYNYFLDLLNESKRFGININTSYYSRMRDDLQRLVLKREFHDNMYSLEYTGIEPGTTPIPDGLNREPHSRISRGAIKQLYQNYSSAVSNQLNGNITDFTLKHKLKKNNKYECLFDDKEYPKWINKIEGYRKEGRVKKSFSRLLEEHPPTGGLTLIHDRLTDCYYIHLPVKISIDDIVFDTQDTIALDPGVRTFQTGYSPNGSVIEIGNKDGDRILKLYQKADIIASNPTLQKRKLRIYRKISNLVDDLHWKTIAYLVNNYNTILIPDFRVQQMLKQKGVISKETKRVMSAFSFYKFKQRLLWKAGMKGVKVHVVNEYFTSKTCSCCGYIKRNLKGEETFNCNQCNSVIGRDINGARNIFIKYIPSLLPGV